MKRSLMSRLVIAIVGATMTSVPIVASAQSAADEPSVREQPARPQRQMRRQRDVQPDQPGRPQRTVRRQRQQDRELQAQGEANRPASPRFDPSVNPEGVQPQGPGQPPTGAGRAQRAGRESAPLQLQRRQLRPPAESRRRVDAGPVGGEMPPPRQRRPERSPDRPGGVSFNGRGVRPGPPMHLEPRFRPERRGPLPPGGMNRGFRHRFGEMDVGPAHQPPPVGRQRGLREPRRGSAQHSQGRLPRDLTGPAVPRGGIAGPGPREAPVGRAWGLPPRSQQRAGAGPQPRDRRGVLRGERDLPRQGDSDW